MGNPTRKGELKVLDVAVKDNHSKATVTLRDSKTSRPGELQTLRLLAQHNILCPVEALLRRLRESRRPNNTLFGYYDTAGQRKNLTRSKVRKVLEAVWTRGNYQGLSGHSFRVGGASLLFALGISVAEIKKLGCWQSKCYSLYIREYSPVKILETKSLIAKLKDCWSKGQ
ncbi:hypothetical protein PCANC_15428 [Puccinia coronata f. sp. avenae]|uniref:Tyr recombinase domain-containing protein n=1 Tax=Puccinia coronata f. sp. avenae TaxID=200324 RepID=A0A2N5SWK6_9BASI|nr:hypothetical protein PCANC_15428 [Puccinia coronata f. sp. avenae]PLW32876.1 hypothetical protein PCASD_20849 [Puccinia coronata f. sp. avenae]